MGGDAMGEAQPTAAMMEAQPTGAAMGGGMDMGGGANGAIYMTINNTGDAADRLMKATGDIAKSIELHTVIKNGDVMQMRPVEAIDVPAKGSVKLMPGGFHVMLIGLNRDLKLGDTVDVTLQFEKAGAIKVTATVKQPE
jgi:copper(I)-binding protein